MEVVTTASTVAVATTPAKQTTASSLQSPSMSTSPSSPSTPPAAASPPSQNKEEAAAPNKRDAANNNSGIDHVEGHNGDADGSDDSVVIESEARHYQGKDTHQTVVVSDSEQETNNYWGEREEQEEEWEDFMAEYWQSTHDVAITPQEAKSLLMAEDTDLQPCAMEPELDEEPNALSPIRMGCMDIDMDYNSMHNHDEVKGMNNSVDVMGQLSAVGLECSCAMTRVGRKEGGKGKVNMDALRIDLGKVEGRALNRSGSVEQQQNSQASVAVPNAEPSVTIAAVPASQDTFDARNTLTSVRSGSTQDLIPTASTQSFDTRSDVSFDAIDRKSTRSSAAGSDAASAAPGDWKHKTSPLPSSELVHMTAPILTRTSLRSLVMKKWNHSYWMHYGPTGLLIFRSKDHMDDWRYNPYHGKKQRDFLVKLHIDFQKDVEREEGVLGHRILPVKKKSYGKNEEMYQFKLEKWTNLGCSVLAAFASQEEDEVQILHDIISEMLRSCPNNGLRNIDHMLK